MTGSPSAAATGAGIPGASPAPTNASPIVIEDAGVEAALPAGTYTSRVFTPPVTFALSGAWLRRDATDKDRIKLSAGVSDRTLAIVRLDFVQCGAGKVLEHPDAAAAAAALAGSAKLSPASPHDVELGDRTGIGIDLPGTGPGVGDAIDPANGCILTAGPAPFPAEALWIVLAPDSRAHLVFVDAGSALVVLSARSQSAPVAELAQVADEVIATVRFPNDPVEN